MLAHLRRDRLKMEAGAAGPIAKGGAIEPDIEYALGDLDVLERQVMLLGAQLFGFGAELVAPEFADDHLKPAPRLFHLGERSLRLRQKRLQPGILCGQGGDIHAPLQSQFDRAHHR